MIKGKDLLNRPIVSITTGEKVETVQDIVFDHQANKVLGLLVEEGGWFRAAKVVLFHRIKSFGPDAVMIVSADDVTSTREDKALARVLDGKINLIGMALLTSEGERLGRISDVYFDEQTGDVEGYEATGGVFADLSSGRTFVPAPDDIQIGEDAAIVPIAIAHAMREQAPGGIKGVFHRAGQSIKGGVDDITDSVRGGVQAATDSVKGAYENIAEASAERQQQYVIGKTAGRELVAEDGTVIVRQGETITALHAEVAQWHGLLTALATTATAQSVKSAYENIGQASEQRQREYAIGKTAGSDLTAEDGTVIVRKGDVINADHATHAEATGKLAALATAATGGVVAGAVGSVTQNLQQEAQEAMSSMREGWQHATGSVKDRLDDMVHASKDRQKEYVIGKTANADLALDDGSVLVRQGETISQGHADRAELAGKLTALTGIATAGALGGLLGSVRARVQDTLEDLKDATAERQKAFVIGKTATRDIATAAGEVIVYKGAVITSHQADRAEQTGTLAALTAAADLKPQAEEPATLDPHDPQSTVGRRARTEVRSESGNLVAAQGQIITPAILERARHLKVDQQLLNATGLGDSTLSARVAGVGAALSSGVSSVSEGASDLLDRAKSWLSDKRDEAEAALSEREEAALQERIRAAVGRPVNRAILRPDDSVILNAGDLITHQAVQHARQAGMLDVLLDSVEG